MPNLTWKDAIERVLSQSDEAMHYVEIAEEIVNIGLRSEFGATPPATVSATIAMSLQNDGEASPFVRVSRGHYALRKYGSVPGEVERVPIAGQQAGEEAGLINAFGMYWARDKVRWKSKPVLLGQQQPGSKPVDFREQKGVYLLHDARGVVYAGRTSNRPLGVRLREHTTDRLNSRWDCFSWFGVYPVSEDGILATDAPPAFTLEKLIVTMEALLIEGTEPRQNRKRGDDFRAFEFLQVEDPEIKKSQIAQSIEELLKKKL